MYMCLFPDYVHKEICSFIVLVSCQNRFSPLFLLFFIFFLAIAKTNKIALN